MAAVQGAAQSATKRIVVVRHGESEYNAAMRRVGTWFTPRFWRNGFDPGIRDAPLTAEGQEQARALGRCLAERRIVEELGISVCVVSPLSRAVQTAVLALRGHPSCTEAMRQLPIVPAPLMREHAFSFGDVGSTPAELRQKFPDVDFSELPEEWWCGKGSIIDPKGRPKLAKGEDKASFHARVAEFSGQLRARPEGSLLVVGHSHFFMELTGRAKLANCGAAEFVLGPGDGEGLVSPEQALVPPDWSAGPLLP